MSEAHRGVKINAIVSRFMKRVAQVADDEDWAESDGWLGKMVIWMEDDPDGTKHPDETYVYAIRDGKMQLTTSRGPFVATMRMSRKTFLDILTAAFEGKGEEVFMEKYGAHHVAYDGGFWIVDSERFRKVFRRMGATKTAGARR